MHEMSLAENLLQIFEASALTQNFQRIRGVVLEIGKLSAVEPEAMRFCFDIVMRGTLAEDAELEIIEVPGAGRCENCNAVFALEALYGLCPACDSPHLQITAGRQMRVKDLSVAGLAKLGI